MAGAVWGTSFIANDVGLRSVDPFMFTAARFVLGAAAAYLVLLVVEPAAARSPPWRTGAVWLFGALNAGAFLLQYMGQDRTSPARAALFVNANVFTVAVLQLVLHRTRPTRGMMASAVVALVGVALLTTGGDVRSLGGGSLLGDLLAFAGGATWAYYLIVQKRYLEGVSPLASITWTFATTAILLVPVALVLGAWPTSAVGWGAIAYTGIVCSTGAFFLWSWGLKGISVTASSVLLLVEVPVATMLAVWLALDAFTLVTGIGALLLFAGVAGASLLEARAGRRRTPEPPSLAAATDGALAEGRLGDPQNSPGVAPRR